MPKSIYATYLAFSLIILPAFTIHAFAQTQGEITGLITDPSGAVIESAVVTATRTTRSNAAGLYSFPSLAPGLYHLKEDFGKIRSTRTPMRELQLGLKYIF